MRALDNAIEVNPAERSDDEIRGEVVQALLWEADLGGQAIDARVEGSEVVLSGQVTSLRAKALAESVAWVKGVRAVDASALRVEPARLAAAGAAPEDAPAADAASPEAEVDPDTVVAAIYRSLDYAPYMEDADYRAVMQGGVVTLEGTVTTLAAAEAATARASRIRGVDSVQNQLQVVPPSRPADDQIAADVQGALATDPDLSATPIEVNVQDGVATLEGQVLSPYHQSLAWQVASQAAGITAVQNRLRLAPAPAGARATGVRAVTPTLQPTTGDVQPVTGINQPATGNNQPATGNVQPATGNIQPATGNVQPSTTPPTTGVRVP